MVLGLPLVLPQAPISLVKSRLALIPFIGRLYTFTPLVKAWHTSLSNLFLTLPDSIIYKAMFLSY
jgi:hypothetical protein